MRFVLATNNQKKLAELRAILDALGAEVMSMADAGLAMEIEETGATFEENALIKARAVYQACGLPAIADDSGLEVDALEGAPGVLTARYAGEHATDDERMDKLLCALKDVPDARRGAQFVSAIACVRDGDAFTVRGVCRGEIAQEKHGAGGFGYDPVFYVPEFGMTFAELPFDVKNRISHRGQALVLLQKRLEALPPAAQ